MKIIRCTPNGVEEITLTDEEEQAMLKDDEIAVSRRPIFVSMDDRIRAIVREELKL